jgi:hypothetical protein
MNLHNLVMSCLAVAYLSANVYAIVKMRVFELARSRKASPNLWRPLHIVGLCHPVGMLAFMEMMRRFDEWATQPLPSTPRGSIEQKANTNVAPATAKNLVPGKIFRSTTS